jgi:hypothetical protein
LYFRRTIRAATTRASRQVTEVLPTGISRLIGLAATSATTRRMATLGLGRVSSGDLHKLTLRVAISMTYPQVGRTASRSLNRRVE